MASIDIGGTRLDYLERGVGEPVVLVHGSASDRRTWEAHLDAVAARFRVVAYSRRYHWPNRRIADGADYPMREHVDDLAALLGGLGLAPAHLVGHSYGAFVCLRLAIRHPECVRTLVLAEPPVLPLLASNPPRPSEILKLLLTRPRAATALIAFGVRGLGPATAAIRRGEPEKALRLFGAAVLGRESFARLTPARLEQVRANFIAAELLGSGFDPVAADEVRGVSQPTLLITGQRSPRLFHRLVDRLEELLPRAERRAIPAASHIVHEDNPPAYRSALLAFLNRHRDHGTEHCISS
jgi:pimeloyl-ACP methyl ester carboxylesterase